MTDLLKDHPILARLAIVVLVWAMILVTSMAALPWVHPDLSAPAASVAVSIIGVPAGAWGVLKLLKGLGK